MLLHTSFTTCFQLLILELVLFQRNVYNQTICSTKEAWLYPDTVWISLPSKQQTLTCLSMGSKAVPHPPTKPRLLISVPQANRRAIWSTVCQKR
ncbi:hypothetical protein PM082_010980 [Marasmius tenuissimus]|nr:hypothetical protein PM082_010980 [Marasmius tenuissimus]